MLCADDLQPIVKIEMKGFVFMKKRLWSVALVVVMAFSLVGCTNKNTDTSNKEISPEEYNELYETTAKVYQKYIKLPAYTGIEVDVDKSILEVTDKKVDEYLDSIVQSYSTTEKVTEGVTAVGDSIVLDYSGKLDGVAFSGGTATDASYTIGSGRFISDLDKGLAGLSVGKSYEIPCTFPESYDNEALKGKNVIFEVTVNYINKTIVPELTDEWVAENAEALGTTEKTVEGLRKVGREYLNASAEAEYTTKKFEAILDKLMGSIEIKEYPKKELDTLKATWKKNVETEYTNYSSYYSAYGINDLAGYKSSVYGCEDDAAFNAKAEEEAKKYLLEKMIITLIAYDNKINVSADDIISLGGEYAEYYQYDSYDAIVDEYGKLFNSELGYGVLTDKVKDILNESAVEVEVSTEKESESGTEAGTSN